MNNNIFISNEIECKNFYLVNFSYTSNEDGQDYEADEILSSYDKALKFKDQLQKFGEWVAFDRDDDLSDERPLQEYVYPEVIRNIRISRCDILVTTKEEICNEV